MQQNIVDDKSTVVQILAWYRQPWSNWVYVDTDVGHQGARFRKRTIALFPDKNTVLPLPALPVW